MATNVGLVGYMRGTLRELLASVRVRVRVRVRWAVCQGVRHSQDLQRSQAVKESCHKFRDEITTQGPGGASVAGRIACTIVSSEQ